MASPQTVINLVCFPFLSKKSAKPYRSSLFAFILCFLMKLRGKQTLVKSLLIKGYEDAYRNSSLLQLLLQTNTIPPHNITWCVGQHVLIEYDRIILQSSFYSGCLLKNGAKLYIFFSDRKIMCWKTQGTHRVEIVHRYTSLPASRFSYVTFISIATTSEVFVPRIAAIRVPFFPCPSLLKRNVNRYLAYKSLSQCSLVFSRHEINVFHLSFDLLLPFNHVGTRFSGIEADGVG